MSLKSDPASGAVAVTPSDTDTLYARSLYIGVSGDVSVITRGRTTPVTFKAHPVGYMPVEVVAVRSTGTSATDILALT